MKATLEFSLPDERDEFRLASNAGALSSALEDFRRILREKWKYAEERQIDLDELWQMFHDCCGGVLEE